MKIKLLSDSTINRITAGEVIERPASVVKELLENSIDANASTIDILLEQTGENLIVILGNDIGMSEEELKIAIECHTTSKLDELDLLNIQSFGFRGIWSLCSLSKALNEYASFFAVDYTVMAQLLIDRITDNFCIATASSF